ncbi:MAG: biotin synthase BioB [Thermodesulfovibrionales bacterium]
MIRDLEQKILAGQGITPGDCLALSALPDSELPEIFGAASRIRDRFRGRSVDLCAIVNAKSGACSEDCAYCAQSGRSSSGVSVFPLLGRRAVLEKAREARDGGARRFCIVTSGRKPSGRDLASIAGMVAGVRSLGLLPCATLGLLNGEDLRRLKEAGLERYHNNLETSERYFGEICTTHTYRDKVETVRAAQSAGLSVCSGGIFGLGETWDDRIAMAFALRDLRVDSVPINFLTPIRGTRMEARQPLSQPEALRIISLYRFVLPDRQIRVCGGRMQTLGDQAPLVFSAGADGLLTGNYLTTLGRSYGDDLKMIAALGFATTGDTEIRKS